ncbi:MAG: hypothetical protein AAF492_28160, partial [Verrucomicrobiota bacterium]
MPWCIATLWLAASSVLAVTNLPFQETFSYPDGTDVDGVNSWEIYDGTGYSQISSRIADDEHAWLGFPGRSAIATNGEGRLDGAALQVSFGEYTRNPGTGGAYDKETEVTVSYDLDPAVGYDAGTTEATTESKFGNIWWFSQR